MPIVSMVGKIAWYVAYRVDILRQILIAWRVARKLTQALRATGGRGLFIDLGSHLGEGFAFFRRYFPLSLFDYVLVEPNPHCAARLREQALGPGVSLIEAAASTREGVAQLYGLSEDQRGITTDGASILPEHNSAMYQAKERSALEVRTFSFPDFLREQQQRYRHVVVKMDIEGAEYEVLRRMVDAGTLPHHTFIEFHSKFMAPGIKTRYQEIERSLKQDLWNVGASFSVWR